jgi:outer membrane protein assembly factor BamB
MRRRRYLAAAASGLALSGCLSLGDDEDTSTGATDPTTGRSGSASSTTDPSGTDTATDGETTTDGDEETETTTDAGLDEVVGAWRSSRGGVGADSYVEHSGPAFPLETVWETGLPQADQLLVADGQLYYHDTSGTGPGRVRALDAATGEELWQHGLAEVSPNFPIVTGDVLLTGKAAINAESGEPRWRNDPDVKGFYAPPNRVETTDGSTVFVPETDNSTAAGLRGLDPATGAERWTTTLPESLADLYLSPRAVTSDGSTLYGTLGGGNMPDDAPACIGVDTSTGEVLWTGDIDGRSADASHFYHAVDGLTAYDATTGDTAWSVTREDPDGLALTGDRVLYVAGDGDRSGAELVARDAATGDVDWRQDLPALSSPDVKVAGDRAYVSYDSGADGATSSGGVSPTVQVHAVADGRRAETLDGHNVVAIAENALFTVRYDGGGILCGLATQ